MPWSSGSNAGMGEVAETSSTASRLEIALSNTGGELGIARAVVALISDAGASVVDLTARSMISWNE